MDHVLDNPAWNAIISGNSTLAKGSGDVRYFDSEVSPFIGLKDNSTDNFGALYRALPHTGPVILVTPTETPIPAQWKLLNFIPGYQMVLAAGAQLADVEQPLVPLTAQHVPQMLALTKLTNPGPFASRTIEFGHYHGVFNGDQLVAMAGQRLNPFNYAEVSAVCTHCDHLGGGYAKQVMLYQMHRMLAAGQTPFLHVRHDNHRAIKIYEHLGFVTRTAINFHILAKA